MAISLTRRALDLGIVTNNEASMLGFYCETLGFPLVGEVTLPNLGRLKKLQCGESQIKLLVLNEPAEHSSVRDNFAASTGYRYCSLEVENLGAVIDGCRKAGYVISVDVMALRPGVSVALVEDPDGNTVEFMEVRTG